MIQTKQTSWELEMVTSTAHQTTEALTQWIEEAQMQGTIGGG